MNSTKKNNLLKYLKLFTLLLFIVNCQKKSEPIKVDSNQYHNLIDKVMEVMVHDVFSPPVASRIFVYPNIASYEIISQKSQKYKSLNNQVNTLNFLNVPKETDNVNFELSALIGYLDVAKELVFSKNEIINYRDSLYGLWKMKNEKEFLVSEKYALKISSQIINWMNQDFYKETRTMSDYNIYSDDPSRWEPTPPAYMKGIEPNWNKIRTMVMDSASQFKPVPHPKFSLDKNSDFYQNLLQVYNVNLDMKKKGNDSEEIAKARFWDCNPFVAVNKGHFMFAEKKITPGAHWIGICKIACKKTNSNLEKTIYAYTKTSLAVFESFISCWDEKYRSNLIRPETLINKYIDESWTPILQTPPFPEYTSGHSVVSGASSEVLTKIFGEDFYFEDDTEVPYGLPIRAFNSFREAAQEAAVSRLYGGIHYNFAIKEGLKQGINIGELVNRKIIFINTDS
jgi:hypothetical protein